MKRITEPELMSDAEQAFAYANADFEEPHNRYLELFQEVYPNISGQKYVLDLGCGPGDIMIRFAKTFPEFIIYGIDGSAEMLKLGKAALNKYSDKINERVILLEGIIPNIALPQRNYDIILATSFLHQLHDPNALWHTIRDYSKIGTIVFITDLFRPKTVKDAERIVEKYSGSELEILKRDFYNSLLAAFSIIEVREQLKNSGLRLSVKKISDRHMLITGTI